MRLGVSAQLSAARPALVRRCGVRPAPATRLSLFCALKTANTSIRHAMQAVAALPAAPPRREAVAAAVRGQRVVTWAAASPDAGSGGQRRKGTDGSVQRSKGSKTGSLSAGERAALAADLQPLAELAGMGAAAAQGLLKKVARLPDLTRRLVVENGAAVARLLLDLGMEREQLAELLTGCPELFVWPTAAEGQLPAPYKEVLQLMLPHGSGEKEQDRLEQAAVNAARCFIAYPDAACSSSFAATLEVLAPERSTPADFVLEQEQLAELLMEHPVAVELLCQPSSSLAQRLADLKQRYEPFWEHRVASKHTRLKTAQEVLAAAVKRSWRLLLDPWDHLLAIEEVLQNKIGLQPGDGTRLVGYLVLNQVGMKFTGCTARPAASHRIAIAVWR